MSEKTALPTARSGAPSAQGSLVSGATDSRVRVIQREPVNVRGGSKDATRGAYVTPRPVARAVSARHRFDLDPFTNPHSHINAVNECMLERGDDGFGRADGVAGQPGVYRIGNRLHRATADTRTWFQPDYSYVMNAWRHYSHTRWVALLRFDPRVEWWDEIYAASELVCVFSAIEFETPPGVPRGAGNSFPHALYFRRAEDCTSEVMQLDEPLPRGAGRMRIAAAWKKRSSLS